MMQTLSKAWLKFWIAVLDAIVSVIKVISIAVYVLYCMLKDAVIKPVSYLKAYIQTKIMQYMIQRQLKNNDFEPPQKEEIA